MNKTQTCVCICLLLALSGCADAGSSRGRWMGTLDTLPNGAVVVSNPAAPLWGEDEAWQLREEVRIGSVDGTGPAVFGEIAGLAVDDGGRIYVLDRRADEVRVFGPDGGHVRTLGRSGEGPGEFTNPFGMTIAPNGHLWVVDQGEGRYSVFDTAGAFLTTHHRPMSWFRAPWPGGIDAAGDLFDVSILDSGNARTPHEIVVRLSADMQIVDSAFVPVYRGADPIVLSRASGGPVMSFGDPFSPRVLWRFDLRGFLWSILTENYEFVQQSFAGDTVRVIRLDVPRPAISAGEKDSARRVIDERIADVGPGASLNREPRMPDEKPAVENFYVDNEGFLWVQPAQAAGEPHRFDVFDAEGRYLGRIQTPAIDAYPLPVFRSKTLYGVVRDSLDVPYVVRWRIEGRQR